MYFSCDFWLLFYLLYTPVSAVEQRHADDLILNFDFFTFSFYFRKIGSFVVGSLFVDFFVFVRRYSNSTRYRLGSSRADGRERL